MELILIRHALPIRREVTTGAADPELSPQGLAQADLLAAYLATENIDAIYASPLQRARQTAAPVGRSHGIEVVVADGVAEYDRDSKEYVPVEELKATGDPRWKVIIDGWAGVDAFATEAEFQRHVVGAVEEIVDRHRGDRVAVVCHGGVINSYLAHVLGLPAAGGFFYPNYTSIHRVAAASSGERTVVTINETGHLRGSGLPIGLFQK